MVMVMIMSIGYSEYISIVSIMVYYGRFKYLHGMCVKFWKWFGNDTLGYTKLGTLGTRNKMA